MITSCNRNFRNEELKRAIANFPISMWLNQRLKVYDTGGKNIQVDCPVCRGKKKLGVNRYKKVAQCFKCSDGGAGGAIWNGRADLIKLICIVDGCDFRAAIKTVYALTGIPEPKFEREQVFDRGIPDEALPLSEAHESHASRQMMVRRGVSHLIESTNVCVDGEYAGRVILPATFFDEVLGWEAKAYEAIKPKSLFPEWFETGRSLYTTRRWDYSADFAIITESIFDAETYGINAVGIFGSVLREGQFSKLLELAGKGIKRLVWSLDFDAWKKQSTAILSFTEMHFGNLVVKLPKWSDPNQLGFVECWKLVQNAQVIRDSTDLVLFDLDR